MYTKNSTETKRLAAKLAKRIAAAVKKNKNSKGATVVALVGDLGAGKTTFVQGFARGLGIKEKITSPTFLIYKKYLISKTSLTNFYHVDAYRIKKLSELKPIKFKEILADPKNLVIIEWADLIKKALPKKIVTVAFKHHQANIRNILIKNFKIRPAFNR